MSTSTEIEITLGDGAVAPVVLASPPGAPSGAVLVVPDIFGRSPFYEGLAGEIAGCGFEVVLVDPFYELGPLPEPTLEAAFARRRNLDEAATLGMLQQVVEWLRGRPGSRGRIGTVGFCMGGTFVLDLAAFERDLATVAFYGFPALYPGIALPPPRPLDLVDRLEGPILALWGENDHEVGMENVEEFTRRCRAAGRPVDCRILPGLGHSFLTATPATDEGLQALVRSAWQDALAHLRAHVGADA